ncbi:MAG: transcription termination/antitermination protein NusA [Nitrospinae bacterium]|nr:transcription termination/antitermination protein NusA [Nitrospinota bacterium]
MNGELIRIIDQIGREKGIDKGVLIKAIKEAVISGVKKRFSSLKRPIEIHFDEETSEIGLFTCKKVVESLQDDEEEILLNEALKIDPHAEIDNVIKVSYGIEDFGRIAAQIAKQVIIQRVREAERESVYNDYKDRQGEIVNGSALRVERGDIIVDLGKTEGILPRREQVFRESFKRGDRIRAYVIEVKRESRYPQVVLSRTHPGLLSKLFEMEVPEIYEGIVEIKGTVREPGGRSKIAVYSKVKDVDPIGACVGMKGVRVQSIVMELRGEKIDIIEWSEDPKVFVTNALSPASISNISQDDEKKHMEIIVPDDQLSLAIGKKGQNVRLAAKLTHWKIDIKGESEFKKGLEEKRPQGEEDKKEDEEGPLKV